VGYRYWSLLETAGGWHRKDHRHEVGFLYVKNMTQIELKNYKGSENIADELVNKLKNNPHLVELILEHDFIDIVPSKGIEFDESVWKKYMLENWNFIEHIQNYTTEKFLKDFKEQFPTGNILKDDTEKFINSYFRLLIPNLIMAHQSYEDNKQKNTKIN
jgi:hypothetical protein